MVTYKSWQEKAAEGIHSGPKTGGHSVACKGGECKGYTAYN